MLKTIALAAMLGPVLGACAPLAPKQPLGFEGLTASAIGPDGQAGGLTPQVDAETGRGDYMLLYRVTQDGQAITTRFVGPSGALGVGLNISSGSDGPWRLLVGSVVRSDYRVTLARWQVDDSGAIRDLFTRKEPFVEWRASNLTDNPIFVNFEWRPLVDGVGVGEWRSP